MPSSKPSTRFRAECLNAHWFLTLADAKEKMEDVQLGVKKLWFNKLRRTLACALERCRTPPSRVGG